jgi:hypothetical protein
MHCYVCYWYVLHLSKISSEINILNFGYLSQGHYISVSQDIRGSKRSPLAKSLENTVLGCVVPQV